MNKKEIKEWLNRYSYDAEPEEVIKGIRKNKYFTKNALNKIIEWKFATMEGRKKKILNYVTPLKNRDIKKISKIAFKIENDKIKVKLLQSIPGVGPSLASTILTFYDSKSYGIWDRHVKASLEKEKITVKNLVEFFEFLRKKSKETGFNCRDVEKAYFQKDYEKSHLKSS